MQGAFAAELDRTVLNATRRIVNLDGLQAEGVLRVPCEHSLQVEYGERLLSDGQHESALDGVSDPHVVASALKYWLRAQRVLPTHGAARLQLSHAAEAAAIAGRQPGGWQEAASQAATASLLRVVAELPHPSRAILAALLPFLVLVAQSPSTRMSSYAVAVCMAPVLFSDESIPDYIKVEIQAETDKMIKE